MKSAWVEQHTWRHMTNLCPCKLNSIFMHIYSSVISVHQYSGESHECKHFVSVLNRSIFIHVISPGDCVVRAHKAFLVPVPALVSAANSTV